LVVTTAIGVFAWFRTRRHDVDERFATGSKKLADLEKRLSAVEVTLLSLPDKEDIHELQMTMSNMNGDMKAMRVTMRSIAESLIRQEAISTRHEEWMRSNK